MSLSIKQSIEPDLERTLTLQYSRQKKRLREKWNKRLADPYAFTPAPERGRVTLQKACWENIMLGGFAADYMRRVIHHLTSCDDVSRMARLARRRKIVAVGFGKNYDSCWLQKASEAGYETWWIDVSDYSCEIAVSGLSEQWEYMLERKSIPAEMLPKKPKIICGEIRSILARPESVNLDLDSVDIWYFCRLLGCLSDRSMESVLQSVGEASLSGDADPGRDKAVVIINAMKEKNPCAVEETTTIRTKEAMLEKLSLGADRPVQVFREEGCMYFAGTLSEKLVSAITVMAAPGH